MIKAIVIDDEVKCVETLVLLLQNYVKEVQVVGTANSAAEGIELIRHAKPDLVFLDVQMPGGDGFYLIQQFSEIDFRIIFTTAHDEYAIRAIKHNALDYLLKPIDISELKEAVSRFTEVTKPHIHNLNQFKESLAKKRNLFEKLAIPTPTEITFVKTDSITYMKSDNNYTMIYIEDPNRKSKQILSSKNIGFYEELLDHSHFFRIHNTYLVNVKKIASYQKGKSGHVVLEDGTALEVSSRRKEELTRLLGVW